MMPLEPHQLDLFKDTPVEPKQLELFEYPPPPPPPGQVELFPSKQFKTKRRDELVMSASELQGWKSQIYDYQMRKLAISLKNQLLLINIQANNEVGRLINSFVNFDSCCSYD